MVATPLAIDALEEKFEQRYSKSSKEQIQDPNVSLPDLTLRICTEILNTDYVEIRIADNGLGITEDIRQRIFDPFFTTKPVGQGTGLGLSISYQIVVEKHSGILECVSTPGKGTEFIIKIPVSI
ncbi:sensor histidine kinase [Chlorogloeopsis fritschii]|uniref:sensor histidine kinase n=1 Tax=Chlorogloeopsis fritschii TaxID=1124 RepID=UPI0023F82AAE|nr:ATP-binding protein [Chlorogloeopsis fritschii]